MLGTLIGDVAGSEFEFLGKRAKGMEKPLFGPSCEFTDDTVCAAGVALWAFSADPFSTSPAPILLDVCRRHADRGFGGRFAQWVAEGGGPYGSWGNGSAMRAGPVAFAFASESDVLAAARFQSEVTHDHPEGVRGACCAALCVFAAMSGASTSEVGELAVSKFGYGPLPDVDQVRDSHRFDVSARGTVPLAVSCAVGARSFEDALRRALSLGGDSDTLGAIACQVAQGLFPIPSWMAQRALSLAEGDADVETALSLCSRSRFGPPRLVELDPEGEVSDPSLPRVSRQMFK